MVIGGGQCNNIGGAGGVIAGGTNNVGGGYNVNWTTIGGGYGNTASGYTSSVLAGFSNNSSSCGSTILGGLCNIASGYSSIAGGYYSSASASGSIALGCAGCAIFPGQLSIGTLEHVPGIVNNHGSIQFSDLLAYNLGNDAASEYTTGQTFNIYPGNNPANLLKPVNNKVWHVTAKYILHVAGIVGGVNGIVTGDTLFGTAEFGYKSGVGGFLTAITDNKAANNANLNTGSFAFTFGPSQEILTTITTPTFTGGGSLRIRASVKFELSEIIQG
jgi:hypothetical protein